MAFLHRVVKADGGECVSDFAEALRQVLTFSLAFLDDELDFLPIHCHLSFGRASYNLGD